MRIEWDDGNWPKCGNHGVSREEIERLFMRDPTVVTDEKHSEVEVRLIAIGKTDGGRNLFVIFTTRERDGAVAIRPISARYMHAKEVRSHEGEA